MSGPTATGHAPNPADADVLIQQAVHNLLVDCAGLQPNETLLIAYEDPVLGWYDQSVCDAIVAGARRIGVAPTLMPVDAPTNAPHGALEQARAAHDCTIFLTRIGDQGRFDVPLQGTRSVMCYLRDPQAMCSAYATVPYQAMCDFKHAVDQLLQRAHAVHLHCAHGTDLRADLHPAGNTDLPVSDVSVRRFPMGVPTPVDGSAFSGRVALRRYLTPTGSRVYEPAALSIDQPVDALVDAGRITGFDGPGEQVDQIRRHYRQVADSFGLQADIMHSWHAGIHPGCRYDRPIAHNPDRWSNTVFCSPRFVHFHTCGSEAPGEICWMVSDPTIELDGVALWQDGQLQPDQFDLTRECLVRWPELSEAFRMPRQPVGLQDL